MKFPKAAWFYLLCIVSTASAAEETVCHDSDNYLVVEGATGEVGTHFLVKYKSGAAAAPVCEYVVKPGDFEIRNEDAEYFLGLQGKLLILDSGTAPSPRGVIVWDLESRSKLHSGMYIDASVGPGYVEFWTESAAATLENCPELKEWRDNGMTAAIETKQRMSLADFKIEQGHETRCSARQ